MRVRFSLRDYKPEDFRTLWAIDQGCFPRGIAYTQFELRTFIQRTSSFTLVVEANEPDLVVRPLESPSAAGRKSTAPVSQTISGFLVAERGRGDGHIITIDVRSEARKRGAGSVLLHAAEERLRLWNCHRVHLETAVDNTAALGFYKKHGYSVTKVVPRYYSNGVDALVLEKDLLSPAPSVNVLK